MNDILFFERTKAKHQCRKCQKDVWKGEMRLTRPSENGYHVVHEHYCLICADAVIKEEQPHLRYAEENMLRAYLARVFKAEPEKYVAKALMEKSTT